MPSNKEFKVNEYLTVKLEKRFAEIYIRNKKVLSCLHVVSNVLRSTQDNFTNYSSVDEYQDSHEYYNGIYKVTKEELFWATCSSLQAWAENNYNTDILSKECSFRLLEDLIEAGDETAKKVFVKEIIRRFNSGYLPVQEFIANSRFSNYLPKDAWELKLKLLGFKQISDFNETSFRFDRKKIFKYENNELKGLGYKDHFFGGVAFVFSLEECVGLEQLFFYNTTLWRLPDSIKACERLKTLIVIGKGNRYHPHGLEELKDSLKNLLSLEKLVFSNNHKLELMPTDIGSLKRLKFIDFHKNSFNTLPESIGDLSNLQTLNLRSNKLTTIPESIGKLKSLKWLDLSKNELETIPASIGDLGELEVLDISNNHLTEIPASISKLSSLRFLYLSKNPLKELPSSFSKLNCVVLHVGEPTNLRLTNELNKDSNFLKKFIDLTEGTISIEKVVINKAMVLEMVNCLKDKNFFQFLQAKKSISFQIVKLIVKELILNSTFRSSILSKIEERLDCKEKSKEIGKFFEIIFENKDILHMISELVKKEPKFYDVFYKIITELNLSYDYWRGDTYQKFKFMSKYVRYKLLTIIERDQFQDYLKMNRVNLFSALKNEDLKFIIAEKSSELLEFIVRNALLFQNSLYDKFSIFEDVERFPNNFPYAYVDEYLGKILSKAIKPILERMDEKEVYAVIKTRLDSLLLKEDLATMEREAVFTYLNCLYEFSHKFDSREDWLRNKFDIFTRSRYEPNANHISFYIRSKVERALEIQNLSLFQDIVYYYDLLFFLNDEDREYLLMETRVIEFIFEMSHLLDNDGYFIDFLEPFCPQADEVTLTFLKQKTLDYLLKRKTEYYETIVRLVVLKHFTADEKNSLPRDVLMDVIDKIRELVYDDYESLDKNEAEKFYQMVSPSLKEAIIKTLERRDYHKIFRIWDKGYLYRLEKNDLVGIFNEHGLNLLDSILKSLHFVAYKEKQYRFDSEIGIVPAEHKYTGGKYKYERIDIVPRELIREYILSIIRNQDLTSLTPLLAAYFLQCLELEDIRALIIDEKSGFFKNIVKIIGDHHDELYYCNDDFYLGHLEFFKMVKLSDNFIIRNLMLSIITDEFITNYESLIEEKVILKFKPLDLIEILESLNKQRFKAFLISLTKAVDYLEENDGLEHHKSIRYFVKIEKFLSDSLKEFMVNIILESEPEPVYWDSGKLIRKDWDLPLNLSKLGWFRHLTLIQLKNLAEHIGSKYKDEHLQSWVRVEFEQHVKMLNQSINEFYDKPLEGLSLSRHSLREFLEKLAGEEGCQFNGLKWRCGGKEFTYAKKILNLMGISKDEQEKLLELCKEYGGYCDCEILMNAAQMLLDEDTPW